MSNNYYVFTPRFIPGTKVRAGAVNTQFDLLEDAFDLLPTDPASIAQGKSTLGVESGSGNAYVVTMAPVRTVNADGDEVVFKATHQNSGASTLQVDAVAAVPLVRWNGDPVSSADILSGSYYVARYDSTNMRFMIVAPAQSTIVGALTYAAPTASVGLAAVAGVATTVMRSDAAPALSQSIVPTWTGIHTFSAVPVFSAGISVTGNATASGLFLGGNGANTGPTFSFSGDPNTGAYNVGADDWGVATGGTLRFDISTTAITSTLPHLNANGSNTAPAFSFSGDPNTGSYNVGADDWGVATGGTLRFDISTTAITATLPFLGANGSNTGPTFSFSGDPNTGAYNVGADDWGVATNGTLRFDISTTAVTSTLPVLGPVGAVGTPTFSFATDPDTGVYHRTTNVLSLSAGGTLGLEVQSTGAFTVNGTATNPSYTFQNFTNSGLYSTNGAVRVSVLGSEVFVVGGNGPLSINGSAGNPSYAFLNDSDTGMYLQSAGPGAVLGFTVDGVQTLTLAGSSCLLSTGQLNLSAGYSTSGTASAGAATLPANPVGFIVVGVAGTARKIPYYAT